jgi:hypothetical protein
MQLSRRRISPAVKTLRFSSWKIIPQRTTNYEHSFQVDPLPHSITPELKGSNVILYLHIPSDNPSAVFP